MAKSLADLAFAFVRDLHALGPGDLGNLTPELFSERVEGIHKGFSAEHEFAAIASWLGKCSLLSQIDDVLHSSAKYRAPDFLVVVNHNGREVPFLVEVKSKDDDRLIWSGKYMETLHAFASLLNLPLLVAWKRGKLWVLTDIRLFTKRVTAFHLSFEEAMKNNLMSNLFGNEWIMFADGFRLELKLKIEDKVDSTADLLPEGTYHMKIAEAGVWGMRGRLGAEDSQNLWWFLVAAASETHFDRVYNMATQQFVADSESMFNLSDVLIAQLLWNKGSIDDIDWLAEIRKGLPAPKAELHTILRRGIDVGAVKYVFQQVPEKVPDFMSMYPNGAAE